MLRAAQPEQIAVNWRHTDTLLGTVVALQLRGGQVWATAELHGDPPGPDGAPPVYWSVESDSRRDGGDVLIRGLAVTPEPAMICSSPLRFLPGELTADNVERWHAQRRIDGNLRDALDTAASSKANRRSGPITVTGTPDQPRLPVNPWDGSPMPSRSRAHPGGFWVGADGHVINVR